MEDMMGLSQRVVQERDKMERLLEEQRGLNHQLMVMRDREGELVSELQDKIQVCANQVLWFQDKQLSYLLQLVHTPFIEGHLLFILQAMDRVHRQELEKFSRRIRDLEGIQDNNESRSKEEATHFEAIIESKSKLIEHLETEKRFELNLIFKYFR
jgi:hypothetical protein